MQIEKIQHPGPVAGPTLPHLSESAILREIVACRRLPCRTDPHCAALCLARDRPCGENLGVGLGSYCRPWWWHWRLRAIESIGVRRGSTAPTVGRMAVRDLPCAKA